MPVKTSIWSFNLKIYTSILPFST